MIERKCEIIPLFRDLLPPLVNTMLAVKPHFREILEGDLDAIGELLTRGFVHRSREYWMRGLHHQGARSLPSGTPRYGYLLEHQGVPVGCLLLIYSSKIIDGESVICCNVSSWYVDPEFRNYAALFASMTQKRKEVTYFNVTPAVATWPILEAQGFVPYCRGLYFSVPALSRGGRGMTVEAVTQDTALVAGLTDAGLTDAELAMLKRHAEYGCLSLVCRTAEEALPFIFFSLRKRRGIIPFPPCSSVIAAASPTTSNARVRSGAICCGGEGRSSSLTRTALWQACPASTARRVAANISRARTNPGSAIWPTPNSPFTACDDRPMREGERYSSLDRRRPVIARCDSLGWRRSWYLTARTRL
jgi:hypothetical protein